MKHTDRDHMAKMRKAKAAKAATKAAKAAPEPPKFPESINRQYDASFANSGAKYPQYSYVHQSPPAQGVMTGVLDVQINTDPDMKNVTLTVKGPAPKMRELVRFAIEQSVPFLNGDKSRH